MAYTALSDVASAALVVTPAVATIGTVATSYIDMALYQRGKFTVSVGTLGTGSVITPVIQQATDTSGTGAKAYTFLQTTTISPITAAAKQSVFNVCGQGMDANNGYRYLNAVVTLATSSSIIGVGFEGEPRATPPALATFQVQVLQ